MDMYTDRWEQSHEGREEDGAQRTEMWRDQEHTETERAGVGGVIAQPSRG